jgi:hypothetical protein
MIFSIMYVMCLDHIHPLIVLNFFKKVKSMQLTI